MGDGALVAAVGQAGNEPRIDDGIIDDVFDRFGMTMVADVVAGRFQFAVQFVIDEIRENVAGCEAGR